MSEVAKGSPISLTSNSLIRYQGKFDFINTQENTVGLMEVYMMGTEGRKNGIEEVPPNPKPFDFIVFRGADIKDLQFDNVPAPPAPPAAAFQDPAVVRSQVSRDKQPQSYASRAREGASSGGMYDRFTNNDSRGGRGGGARGGRGGDSRQNFNRDNFGADSVEDRYNREKFSGNNDRRGNYGNNHQNQNFDDRRDGRNVRPYEGGRRGGGGQGYTSGQPAHNTSNNHNHGGHHGGHGNHGGGYGGGNQESHTGRDFAVPPGNMREKLEEFDFAKSSEAFEKEKAEFRAKQQETAGEAKAYNKSSFFDSLSSDKGQGRLMRGIPRAADSETFGTDMVGAMQGFRSGRGGRGGRGQYNRY